MTLLGKYVPQSSGYSTCFHYIKGTSCPVGQLNNLEEMSQMDFFLEFSMFIGNKEIIRKQ